MKEMLYQYAVLKHPTSVEAKDGRRSVVVVPPSVFDLYKSEQEVVMRATRMIPEDVMNHADQLEVVVRPF